MSNHPLIVSPLSQLTIVEVGNEQRYEYLHGQLTVATQNFDAKTARIAAHCDFKGKMFAALTLSEYDDKFLLSMHHESAQESLLQLKKYGVFSKVDIEQNKTLNCVGVAGEHGITLLNEMFNDLPQEHLHLSTNEYGQAICFNDSSLRYLCYLNEQGLALLNQKMAGTDYSETSAWEKLEIEAGLGNIQQATLGEFVPQMLNFQAINAIDFDKGCYMGQEVVARTKFLGKNKRACFILEADCETLPEQATVGKLLEIQLDENWRRGGVINRACFDNGRLYILAVMANDTEVGSVVRLKDTEVHLKVCELPYTLSE
ncbi:tRNA-modifying protein YgfZ [Glaciecola sp. 2405UD65-10]|uniref:tRNA-modifying protein YgfZ n=1 Tax=Glaciecola sp. 2405UD65-10 TaxID=3397244 RepID=UPI003B5CB337